jgi:hypothetical protein
MPGTLYDEKTAPAIDERDSTGLASGNVKAGVYHEETAHEAAERGHVATDQ